MPKRPPPPAPPKLDPVSLQIKHRFEVHLTVEGVLNLLRTHPDFSTRIPGNGDIEVFVEGVGTFCEADFSTRPLVTVAWGKPESVDLNKAGKK